MSDERIIPIPATRNTTLEAIQDHIETAQRLAHQMALLIPSSMGKPIESFIEGDTYKASESLDMAGDVLDLALLYVENAKKSLGIAL